MEDRRICVSAVPEKAEVRQAALYRLWLARI